MTKKVLPSDAMFYMHQFIVVDFGGKRLLFEEICESLDACELRLVADLS